MINPLDEKFINLKTKKRVLQEKILSSTNEEELNQLVVEYKELVKQLRLVKEAITAEDEDENVQLPEIEKEEAVTADTDELYNETLIKLDELQTIYANLEEQFVTLSKSNDELVNEYTALKEENARLKEAGANVDAENLEVEDLLAQLGALKVELENANKNQDKLKAQVANLKTENEALKAAKLELEAKSENDCATVGMSIEDLTERLEFLRERLKNNEKELKIAKKEFLPLNKIRKTLDNDKKKLRRKEALVAKQKVVLYGVNNIADIDKDKAQKLQEELDLLDGLRLSVQHCEEVMFENKDRLPLLEKNYTILNNENENLKEDIRNCEDAILKIKQDNDIQ